jgi:hypothetical protein
MNGILGKLLSNPHTTGAGAVFFVLKAGEQIALTWFPAHADKIKTTSGILEGVAGFYGLALAGDAGKGAKDLQEVKAQVKTAIDTGNSEILAKKDLPTPAEAPKPGA